MNLYAKVILLLCSLFAAYGATNYMVQREVILPSFERLEEDLARTDMERIVRALDGELAQLLTFCADWGNWLETYRFMAGENPAFIDENMTPSTIEAAGLDLVAYLHADGRFAWAQGFDPGTHEPAHYRLTAAGRLPPDHPFLPALAEGRGVSGLFVTEHGPAMIVAAPVLDGAGNGPHHGAVLLARVISPEVAARLAEQAQVRLQVGTTPPGEAGIDWQSMLASARVVRREHTNEVYRALAGIDGRPAMTLRIDVPRSVSAQGRDAIGFALVSILVAGALATLVLVLALRGMVLWPVRRMTRHAVAIAAGDDLTRRMGIERGDELGVLAREFDRMVDQLADTRRRLVDQSFEAGAAQVASGLLHNIGNAMTPLGVTVATLQQRLRDAPAGEIEMVLAELETGDAPAARRADLEQFLRLACRELSRVIAAAGDDAETVARQAEAIQRILAHQLRASQAGPVIETVRLAELVEQSAELVPPALRQRLRLEVDADLRRLGPVPLARVTVQQVFQNLIQNAAESVRDAGQELGRLRIGGELETAGDATQLLLRFTDDGGGIEPGQLERIFEKGFSTKPRATNFGIGLHWCANAVNALGGSIRAESAGAGRGATLIVALPLRPLRGIDAAQAA